LVIPEAREAGCAIIASRVDGIPEALDHGDAGYLVPPKSAAALAAKISELLTDRHLLQARKHCAQNNRSWLHLSRVHHETMSIYAPNSRN
jgi:glycosyltransferase involved in cell wall biosynthesis